MATIFTKIINGEISSYKIAEDDKCYAFLDISPLAKGHTLVVPKAEVDYIFKLDDELLQHMILFSKKIAKAIDKSVNCKRVGMAVVGLEVPHAHIHLIPLHSDAINFAAPKLHLEKDEFQRIAERIIANLS